MRPVFLKVVKKDSTVGIIIITLGEIFKRISKKKKLIHNNIRDNFVFL